MKPISRLRMRARSESVSDSAGLPFSQYFPLVGESRRPSSESSVDLPQPDGPAIDTYSPWPISRCTPESACVSTSSVKNTFVTPSSLMTGWPLPFGFVLIVSSLLPQTHPVVRVPRAHVREDHRVPDLQAAQNLHRVHGALAEPDLHPHRLVSVGVDAEEADLRLLRAEGGPADVEDILQPI